MKRVYVAPQTTVTHANPVCMMASSWAETTLEDVFAVATENGWPIQLCPYTNQRCSDMQKRLNDWANAVKYFAATGTGCIIYTTKGMFDKCPHCYTSVCAQHEQKQR